MHVPIHKMICSIHWNSLLHSLLCFTFLLVVLDPFMVSLQTSQQLIFTTDFVMDKRSPTWVGAFNINSSWYFWVRVRVDPGRPHVEAHHICAPGRARPGPRPAAGAAVEGRGGAETSERHRQTSVQLNTGGFRVRKMRKKPDLSRKRQKEYSQAQQQSVK